MSKYVLTRLEKIKQLSEEIEITNNKIQDYINILEKINEKLICLLFILICFLIKKTILDILIQIFTLNLIKFLISKFVIEI